MAFADKLLLLLLHPFLAGSGDCRLEFSAHKQGVNALASLKNPASQPQQQQPSLLLSAGKDHAVRMWQVSAVQQQQQQQQQQASKGATSSISSASAQCVVLYKGHKEAVQAVAVSPAADMCCSGGWDGQLLLWRTGGCRFWCCIYVSMQQKTNSKQAGQKVHDSCKLLL
jgi:WD40 repeat protein